MKILNLVQGTPEWIAARTNYFTASEAPAMLGLSKYKSRDQLLREKATGVTEDVDAAKQRLFDAGHDAEDGARPIVEAMIGEDLFPATGTLVVEGLPLLASFDGINMAEDTCWENKLYRADLAQDIEAGEIDDLYWPQLEQQLLVSGAERVYFTASDGTKENTIGIWYASVPARRRRLIASWKQFAEDLANYKPAEVIPAAVATPINELPALNIQIIGNVVASNLADWKGVVTQRIDAINTNLQTDQDFADADAMTKFLDDGEKKIDLVKAQAQAQAEPIDTLFRALDEIRESMRQKRLSLEKLVKARKESIRSEIMQSGQAELTAHIKALNKRLARVMMPAIPADFAGAMKGKKTVDSLKSAVSTVLANAKVEADTTAERIEANLSILDALAGEYMTLFADLASIANKQTDDFTALVKTRIAEHKESEEKRRQEEQARQARAAEVATSPAQSAAPVATTERQAAVSPVIADAADAAKAMIPSPAVIAPARVAGEPDTAWQIAGRVSEMNEMERCRVLQFCERVIEQRQAAA